MKAGREERGQNENKKDLSDEFGAAFFSENGSEALSSNKSGWMGVLATKAISSHFSAGSKNKC